MESSALTIQEQLYKLSALLEKLVKIAESQDSFKGLIVNTMIRYFPVFVIGLVGAIITNVMRNIISNIVTRSQKDKKKYAFEINSMLNTYGVLEKKFSINLQPNGFFASGTKGLRNENGFEMEVKTFNFMNRAPQAQPLPVFENSEKLTTLITDKSKLTTHQKNTKKEFYGQVLGAYIIHGTYGTGKTYIAEQLASHSFGKKAVYIKIQCKLLLKKSDGEEKKDCEISSTFSNIKNFIKVLSDKINDSNTSIVLNLDETDVHPDLFKYLQSMLDEEFTCSTSKNIFKTSRMLVCSTNKTDNINQDSDSEKTVARLQIIECLAYTQEQFINLLDTTHGEEWIQFLLKECSIDENYINDAKKKIKEIVKSYTKKKIENLIEGVTHRMKKHNDQHSILLILKEMKNSFNSDIQELSKTLYLILSDGKLECDECDFNAEAIAQFNSFFADKVAGKESLMKYLITNCRFLDFRTIEKTAKCKLQQSNNIEISSNTEFNITAQTTQSNSS